MRSEIGITLHREHSVFHGSGAGEPSTGSAVISFTVFVLVLVVNTYLQFVLYLGFVLVASFVLVTQSFTDIGFNRIVKNIFLHDVDSTGVIIKWESFTRILAIRTLPVHTSFLLQWKERGVRRILLQVQSLHELNESTICWDLQAYRRQLGR